MGYDNDGLVTDEGIEFVVKNSLASGCDRVFTDITSIKEPQLAYLIPTLVSGPSQPGFSQRHNRYENDGPRRRL